MKIYVDCGSGIAGDMLLSAFIGLGVSPVELERTLRKAVPMKGWRLAVEETERQGWPAKAVRVEGDRPFGSPERMKQAVRRAALPGPVQERASAILSSLQQAEAQAHGHHKGVFDPEGLGLLDTLVDVLGNAWAIWRLGIEEVEASPLNTGRIAPAVARLVARFRIPVYSPDQTAELATPTGVAILGHIAKRFVPLPPVQMERAAYGAGQRDFPGRPNILGLYQIREAMKKIVSSPRQDVGRGPASTENGWGPAYSLPGRRIFHTFRTKIPFPREPVLLLETAIDDMDPRLYPYVSDRLFQAGALDVWWVSAGMKKGRPGILFSVLCHEAEEEKLLNILFKETTTLGVRRLPMDRWVLSRYRRGYRKVARLPGGLRKSQVEFEIARARAGSNSIPLKKLLK